MRTKQLRKNKLPVAMYNIGGYKSRYNIGGLRRRQNGGMYADNTAQSVGQGGGPLNTSSIVYQESNPALQAQRVKGLEAEQQRLIQQGLDTTSDIEETIERGDIKAEQDAQLALQQQQALASTVKTGAKGVVQAGKEAGLFKGQGLASTIAGARDAYKLTRGANLLAKGAQGISAGVQTANQAAATAKGAQMAFQGVPYALPTATSTAASTGSAIGAGVGKFASSGAGLGLIATGLGYGVEKLWGDDDPTTTNFAEGTGGVLKGAGTGAALGSMIMPGIGTVAGGIIGGAAGLASKLWGSKKAKKAEEKAKDEYEAKVKKQVTKHNKELMKNFATQKSAVRSGELAQKTYSGYDLGRNIVAQMGGMRMGTPRYGYRS